MSSEDSLLDVGDIAAGEPVARQRVRTIIEVPKADEFILDLIETLDLRFDEMMVGGVERNKTEGVNERPFCNLGKVAGGILGALRLNGWERDRIVELVVQKSEKRLPLDLIQRVVDKQAELLTYVNTRVLPSNLDNVEIYGYTYQVGDGLPELSFIEFSDGYGDFEGLYGLWAMRKDSRDQWEEIASDLEGRGVERVGDICLNMTTSHILMEEGFVEAFTETFPGSSPYCIDINAYVD